MNRSQLLVLALCSAVAFGACRRRPPKTPMGVPSASASAAEPEPAPSAAPAPPRCEAISEKCTAASDTKAPITDTGVELAPPSGWTYAKESVGVVAYNSAETAAFVFGPSAGAEPDQVLAALEPLLKRLEVEKVKLDSLKKRLKKPQSTVEVGAAKVSVWEVDKASQKSEEPTMKGKPGRLLVVVAPIGGKVVVGAAFVVMPDAEAEAAAILTVVQSLHGST